MKNHSLQYGALVAGGIFFSALPPASGSEAEREFRNLDANEDGRVSSVEYATFSGTHFMQSDVNHDGRISAAEWDAAHASSSGRRTDRNATAAQLRLMDADGDGLVSDVESAQYGTGLFIKADKNGDGFLTENEYEVAARELKKAQKQSRQRA